MSDNLISNFEKVIPIRGIEHILQRI